MDVLTRAGLAERWGVGATTIDRWRDSGRIPAPIPSPKLRGRVWSVAEIERWEAEHMPPQGDPRRAEATAALFRQMVEDGRVAKTELLASAERSLSCMVCDACANEDAATLITVREAAKLRRVDILNRLPEPKRSYFRRMLADAFLLIDDIRSIPE